MPARVSESVVLAGSPEDVWPFVTDGRHFQTCYAFGGAEIDLRPGGTMTLRWDEHGAFPAVVQSVVPGRLFAFRWQPAPAPLVEIRLSAEGGGATRVDIVESGDLDNPE